MRLLDLLITFDDALDWALDDPLVADEPLLAEHEPPSGSVPVSSHAGSVPA
jgi:hypothetical protein